MLDINKMHLGDSYDLIKQIDDKSIDLVIIDPPYELTKGGVSKSELGKRIKKNNDEIKFISNGFNNSILDELCRVMKKINIYVWCSRLQLRQLLNYFENVGGGWM